MTKEEMLVLSGDMVIALVSTMIWYLVGEWVFTNFGDNDLGGLWIIVVFGFVGNWIGSILIANEFWCQWLRDKGYLIR